MTLAIRRDLGWRQTTVAETIDETLTARTLVFDSGGWPGHVAGQHIDLRLTADDGYQATRSYSLSSGPTEPPQITVETVDDGEVSPFLVEAVEKGDELELRGPIGGYFVWEPVDDDSVLLVGGGSGIAPLRALWRARTPRTRVAVLYSARTEDRLIFADELRSVGLDARVHLTRADASTHPSAPTHASVAGRIDRDHLRAALDATMPTLTFVCGPTAFVEHVADTLVDLAVDPGTIRTERFG